MIEKAVPTRDGDENDESNEGQGEAGSNNHQNEHEAQHQQEQEEQEENDPPPPPRDENNNDHTCTLKGFLERNYTELVGDENGRSDANSPLLHTLYLLLHFVSPDFMELGDELVLPANASDVVIKKAMRDIVMSKVTTMQKRC